MKTVSCAQVVVSDLTMPGIGTELNYLAMELKKGAAADADEGDLYKLWAYRQPDQLGYRHVQAYQRAENSARYEAMRQIQEAVTAFSGEPSASTSNPPAAQVLAQPEIQAWRRSTTS